MNAEVISCIETEKLMKPSVYVREPQDRLLLDGVVHLLDLPSKSAISKSIREDLYMTKKKIQQIPSQRSEMNSLKQYPTWNQAPFAVLTRVVL